MNPKTVIVISALVGIVARYHLKELARVHLYGFSNGWEAGKNFEAKRFPGPKDPLRPSALHEWPIETRLTDAIDPRTGKLIRVVLIEEADRIHNILKQERNTK